MTPVPPKKSVRDSSSRFGRALAGALDFASCAAAAVAAFIAIAGGGSIDIVGHHIRAHSAGPASVMAAAAILCRCFLMPSEPLLWISPLSGTSLMDSASRILHRWYQLASTASLGEARRFTAICMAISFPVLLLNAYTHFGFFSGDDVEIHEMTLSRLVGAHWHVWSLRSPFFPMIFIYPIQLFAAKLGVVETGQLVFAGRVVVSTLATLSVAQVFTVSRITKGLSVACVAVMIFVVSRLHLAFGSTELPRPVSTCFVLAAFASLMLPGLTSAVVAGFAMGAAGAMRFSEVLFILPATVWLVCERQWSRLLTFLAVFGAAALAIQSTADYAYWGEAFASIRAAVDFTVVKGLSSRGYQSGWFYLIHVGDWCNVVVFGLAVSATRREDNRRIALWAWLPLLCLSLLPHKEARYAIPAMPFVSILAASELVRLVQAICQSREPSGLLGQHRTFLALMVIAVLCACGLTEAEGAHFRRSEAEVRLARRLALVQPSVAGVAVEQAWRLGGHLYFRPAASLVDFSGDDVSSGTLKLQLLRNLDINTVVVTVETCRIQDCGNEFESLGFHRVYLPEAAEASYIVLRR